MKMTPLEELMILTAAIAVFGVLCGLVVVTGQYFFG